MLKHRGVTLLEVLVSIIVLAIFLIGICGLLTASLYNLRELQHADMCATCVPYAINEHKFNNNIMEGICPDDLLISREHPSIDKRNYTWNIVGTNTDKVVLVCYKRDSRRDIIISGNLNLEFQEDYGVVVDGNNNVDVVQRWDYIDTNGTLYILDGCVGYGRFYAIKSGVEDSTMQTDHSNTNGSQKTRLR
jgi:prepilin-type N-terminal cleavage/methylation domain-containing protein